MPAPTPADSPNTSSMLASAPRACIAASPVSSDTVSGRSCQSYQLRRVAAPRGLQLAERLDHVLHRGAGAFARLLQQPARLALERLSTGNGFRGHAISVR